MKKSQEDTHMINTILINLSNQFKCLEDIFNTGQLN